MWSFAVRHVRNCHIVRVTEACVNPAKNREFIDGICFANGRPVPRRVPDRPNMQSIKRILLATDLNAESEKAVQFISSLAHQLEAQLHLLHVASVAGRVGPTENDVETLPDEAREQLRRLALTSSMNRTDTITAVRTGRPAQEIVSYAALNDINLIAMGSRGRTHLAQALLGSVAEQVVRTAPCPVLVLPPACFRQTAQRLILAVRSLAARFGPGVIGAREESRLQLVSALEASEHLENAEADSLVATLEGIGGLVWHEGPADGGPNSRFWAINPDALSNAPVQDLLETSEVEAAGETSAAIDLLKHAIDQRATDLHLDPLSEDEYEVRLRIDGRLEHYCRLDRKIAAPLTQQYKVLAHLDIADPFKPQEGRLAVPGELGGYEIRITTAPVHEGQAIALRLFSSERLFQPLESLGLSRKALDAVGRMLEMRSGLVLVTGPTGSGKTTTIYSLLHQLSAAPNIVSIEDPVEYRLPFMRQVAVDPRHGITMTSGLRTILRMDPDVVFLGEIRDGEAADIAMRAASAGRFVFSTLHTRDVASTITALRDLHVDMRSLGPNLTGIISQRLVRRLCPDCCRVAPSSDEEKALFTSAELPVPAELMRPVGCGKCRNTGYRDRVGLFEAVTTVGMAAEAIAAGVSESEFNNLLREMGASTLLDDGLHKVAPGITTLEEILERPALPGSRRLE